MDGGWGWGMGDEGEAMRGEGIERQGRKYQ